MSAVLAKKTEIINFLLSWPGFFFFEKYFAVSVGTHLVYEAAFTVSVMCLFRDVTFTFLNLTRKNYLSGCLYSDAIQLEWEGVLLIHVGFYLLSSWTLFLSCSPSTSTACLSSASHSCHYFPVVVFPPSHSIVSVPCKCISPLWLSPSYHYICISK